jgi:hypothetical protein
MKRIISLSVIILFSGYVVFAQELNQEQTFLYNRMALSVEVETGFIGSINQSSGMIYGSQVKIWTGYKGFSPVSEEEFFTLAGYSYEAMQAKKYHSTSIGFIWGGLAGVVAGIGLFAACIGQSDSGTLGIRIGAVVISSTGSTLSLIGLLRGQWATANNAINIADQYNNILKKQIASGQIR